ncbi:hypothetical protein [Roseicyclus marinus]|uniref:hypothetical protein n=1 Tax=Roseicyclus marinus TaxID=2161673 RepID=UPI0024101C36|nr:hypothetical protein [Roseicyclus marinus]MDG3039864.1 hypothetical protein [Roseicyclus marinus]
MNHGSRYGNNANTTLGEPNTVVVPRVALADPSVEPSDEALEALCAAAIQDVIRRHLVVEAEFQDRMKSALIEAIHLRKKDRLILKQ